jgi:hypothetical protein
MRLWNPVSLTAVLFLGFWLAYQLSPLEWFPPKFQPYLSFAVWPVTLAALGGILSLVSLLKAWGRLSVLLLMGTLIIAQTYLAVTVPPRFNEWISKKPFSRQILARVAHGDELKIWKLQSTGLLYYTGRSIEQIKRRNRLVEVLSGPRRVFLIVEEKELSVLNNIENELLHPLVRAKGGRHMLYLFSNQGVGSQERADGDEDRKIKGEPQTPRFVQAMSRFAWRWVFFAAGQNEEHGETK